ncbi:dynein regulatory complex protein 9 isoform X3 [Diceros bicornis minor]|uniref:dynein regulatory complex protein 9 isoform X3 n=1 Tax=Diceros bicornis minor TaxID=77932 RepID=UPI0026E9E196|nr:dynein regulatory complex protein 9 isoform X3 [Diceros bicornis minor]
MEEGWLEASNLPPEVLHSEVTVSVTGEPPSAVEEEKEAAKETNIENILEIIEPLFILDVLRISAVLEDTIDQLSILNYIMPVQYESKLSTSMKKSKEMNLEGKSLEKLSEALKTSSPFIPKEESELSEIRPEGQFANEFNKMQDLVFKKPITQTIMTTETLKKIQIDSEEKGRKQIKSLQKQLLNVKRERQAEVQGRNEYIAHLKDQLQEMKAKTNMENRYMKRNTELQISQTQKKCNKTEELLLEEIEVIAATVGVNQKLRSKTEEENRIHMEIELFLRKEQQKLEEKLEFWMEKFDKDTEMKQNELNALKSAKATDLAHLQDLAKTLREYEQVIIEDRLEKERTRKKIEQDRLELKSIIKLQAWWRGTVVRNEIGGFRMPRKDIDDSKDSKGKGKDKRRGKK